MKALWNLCLAFCKLYYMRRKQCLWLLCKLAFVLFVRRKCLFQCNDLYLLWMLDKVPCCLCQGILTSLPFQFDPAMLLLQCFPLDVVRCDGGWWEYKTEGGGGFHWHIKANSIISYLTNLKHIVNLLKNSTICSYLNFSGENTLCITRFWLLYLKHHWKLLKSWEQLSF